jgi:tetratricopeptide (TPR) repeat protein
LPKLHWTAAAGAPRRAERYRPAEADFRLPALFWEDLADVLRLLVATRAAAFDDERGRYVADRLQPFIDKVRTLLAGSDGHPGWDADATGRTRVTLATALVWLGEQNGQRKPLEDAVEHFRQALVELPRERVPLLWAATQYNLGLALATLGQRQADAGRLRAALAALRAAREVIVDEAGQTHRAAEFDQKITFIEERIRELDGSGRAPPRPPPAG